MTEGYDCGDAVAEWLKTVLETDQPLRLIYFVVGLYSERDVVPKKEWMLNPVPIRRDPVFSIVFIRSLTIYRLPIQMMDLIWF